MGAGRNEWAQALRPYVFSISIGAWHELEILIYLGLEKL